MKRKNVTETEGTIMEKYLKNDFNEYVQFEGKEYNVSYLVAETFIPNPMGYKYVVHKNGVAFDNRADNLEWSPYPETKELLRKNFKKTLWPLLTK